MKADRLLDLRSFYGALGRLDEELGRRTLATSSGRLAWPQRGVYFFMEEGEGRTDSGTGPRIVRVGTHALTATSRTSLWTRLSQHRGRLSSGRGNHRGSIFRLLVGAAMISRDGIECSTWGVGAHAESTVRASEAELEKRVSSTIGTMPFLWLPIMDEPGAESLRGYIERNSIALLSNYKREPLDPPSSSWLGQWCDRERVRRSGLWNQNHVEEHHDPMFLERLRELVAASGRVT